MKTDVAVHDGIVIDEEAVAALGLVHVDGIGPKTVQILLQQTGSLRNIYHLSERALGALIGDRKAAAFRRRLPLAALQSELRRYQRSGIALLPHTSDSYPGQLRHLADPPIGLFVTGDLSVLQQPVAQMVTIVGTRSCTAYGTAVARSLAQQAVSDEKIVVSGLAEGIDAVAHQGVVDAGGRTIAVLGSGVSQIVPTQNTGLAEQIIQSGGAVVSEYLPSQRATKGTFVARNRIVAALSATTVIVEGAIKSGAMITARFAAELGREVAAVPGRVTDRQSSGPLRLIADGAVPILLEHDDDRRAAPSSLSAAAQAVYTAIAQSDQSIDQLHVSVSLETERLLEAVTELELSGLISRGLDGMIARVP